MTPPKTSMLFIASKGPWSGAAPGGCLDAMLTAAAFDQKVAVIFCSDGVYQLLDQQDGSKLEQKVLANAFPALELYDIHDVYVEELALTERGLSSTDLLMPAALIDAARMQALVADSDTVLVF